MATGQVFHNLRETNEKLTGPPARQLLENAHVFDGPFRELTVLDSACGGGVLTRELFDLSKQQYDQSTTISRVVAADIDERMLAYVKQLSSEWAWQQVETMKFDQAAVPLDDATFTHVLSSFGIFFSPDDNKVLSETLRLLQPNGIAGFTSWEYLGWWHDIAEPVLEKCFPDAPSLPHPSAIFPSKGWNDSEVVRSKLENAGLKDVQVEELSFTPDTEAEGFAAACAFLVKGMAAKLWPTEVNEKYAEQIQPEMSKFLRERYEGGKWDGKMIALVATGRRE